MSADEDTELRDLVAQTLEANGVLGKIRAQLRASVFLALEEQESIQNKTPFLNSDLQSFLSTPEGCQAVLLIKEFLQFFKLDYTLAVFEPELSCSSEKLDYTRNVLSRQLGLTDTIETAKLPLLASVVRQVTSGDAGHDRRPSLIENAFEVKVAERNGVNAAHATGLPTSQISKPDAKGTAAGRKNSTDSDVDSDSFFDDGFLKKSKPFEKKEDTKASIPAASKAGASSLSSLADLPSLANGRNFASQKDDSKEKSEIIDLEYDDDKYEDDFQGSNISPLGQTPRSARSDKNVKSIENDEIDEEIEEDLSIADDLLKSDRSVNDDLTTDRTVSPAEQSAAGDYVEDVLRP